MREIKFRGKRRWDNTIIYSRDFTTHENGRISMGASGSVIYKDTFGQFTGLKDKNGKDIYEGDILKTNGLYQTYFVVEYRDRSFELYTKKNSVFDPHNTWGDYEIVGNIHENKELLK